MADPQTRHLSQIPEPVARRIAGKAVVRAVDEVPRGVPVTLRSAQHVTVSKGRFEPFAAKRLVLVQWVLRGQAAMMVDGKPQTYRPGDVAVYLPTAPMQFWAVAPANEMCWFTVDGPLAEPLAIELELKTGVYPSVPAPIQTIHRMMELLRDHTIRGWRKASLLAIETLYEVANLIRTTDMPAVVGEVQHLIQQEFGDANLSVGYVASRMSCHRGSLSRLFHRHAGVTIVNYIAQVRLQESKALLQHSDDTVEQIARKCGFRDAAYFCRWLRRHTGRTPSQVRARSDE